MEIKIKDATIKVDNISYDKENGNYVELSGKMDKGKETNKLVYYTLDSYINDHLVEISIGGAVFSKKISGTFKEEGHELIYTIHIFIGD